MSAGTEGCRFQSGMLFSSQLLQTVPRLPEGLQRSLSATARAFIRRFMTCPVGEVARRKRVRFPAAVFPVARPPGEHQQQETRDDSVHADQPHQCKRARAGKSMTEYGAARGAVTNIAGRAPVAAVASLLANSGPVEKPLEEMGTVTAMCDVARKGVHHRYIIFQLESGNSSFYNAYEII